MFRLQSYIFIALGIILFGLTFTFQEKGFTNYFIETNSENPWLLLSMTPNLFRLIVVIYFATIAFISYMHYRKNKETTKRKMIVSILVLTIPIYFYVASIQNAMTASDIWCTILPFYHYPQSYMDIATDYFRFIILLFILNFIYLIYFTVRPSRNSIVKLGGT